MNEKVMTEEIWKIWNEVHKKIGPLRDMAFKIQGHAHSDFFFRRFYKSNDESVLGEIESNFSEKPNIDQLENYAKRAEIIAMKYQKTVEGYDDVSPRQLLDITSRAGHLLGLTERIMACYDTIAENSTTHKKLDTGYILSYAMTVIATARDHIGAAQGHIKNIETEIGQHEYYRLVGIWLVPAVAIYLLFHPNFDLPFSIPNDHRVSWEVLFWSWFGAVSISLITISEDVLKGTFDPRKIGKYRYRIPIAPFVSTILIMFLSMFGLSVNSNGDDAKTLALNISGNNIPIIIILSFLFGFFGKRSLDLLDEAWRRIFPSTRPKEDESAEK